MLGNVGFLKPFYHGSNFKTRNRLRKLVENGQLLIMNGGSVSSHDEASTYFHDIVSNLQVGASWLEARLNISTMKNQEILKSSVWTVDSFGHSLTSMYLMANGGMTNYISNRIDSVEKWLRRIENTMAFSWVFERKIFIKNIQKVSEFELKDKVYDEKLLIRANLMLDHYSYPDNYFLTSYSAEMNPMKVDFRGQKTRVIKLLSSIDYFAASSKHRVTFVPFGNDF